MKLIIRWDKFNTFTEKYTVHCPARNLMIHQASLPADFHQYSPEMKINVF